MLSVINSNAHQSIEWIKRSSPAFHSQTIVLGDDVKNLDLGNLVLPDLYKRYRVNAEMYFELGLLSETLFWLNAGIEAFFELRIRELSTDPQYVEVVSQCLSARSFWEEAQEVVSSQFPETALKLKWPNKEVHSSMYNKLRYIAKKNIIKISKKELLAKYYEINKFRNDLFHGRSESPLNVDVVKKAFSAFDFLVDNFVVHK